MTTGDVAADLALETRVLLFVSTRKDAEVTRSLLRRGGMDSVACDTIDQLLQEILRGAGAVLLTEQALLAGTSARLIDALRDQPEWSDLPLVLSMRGGSESPRAEHVLKRLPNVTVIERPAPMRSVLSSLQAAVRSRLRQYEIRAHLDAIQRAEARARDLQMQLETAVNASELGTFYCEIPLGRIQWSERCRMHFSVDAGKEVDFDLFYARLHPDDRERTRQAIEACVYQHQIYDVEYRVVSPQGAIRWIRACGRTSYDAHGKPLRFDGTTQDITPRKQMENEKLALLSSERAARMEAERANRLKDEFLATLSHELRTPLSAITGWTQLLKEEPDDVETVREGVETIERNAQVQAQLIEDLLDVSRITSDKVRLDLRDVHLGSVVQASIETVAPAAHAQGVSLTFQADDTSGIVSGDPGRLQQVLWNLLTNAVKFTPSGGHVQVRIEHQGTEAVVSVSDTGEGMPPEFLPHLFERFSQADGSTSRRHGGLGLGLALVKALTEMHGGTVSAESAGRGQGSTFRVRLPLRPAHTGSEPESVGAPAPQAPAPPGVRPTRLDGLRVLVVDDEPDARQILRRLILGHGGTPETAASAQEATGLIGIFRPHVIVSDIGMPETDGYTFMRQVRSRGVTTPAVALTAFARVEDRIRALESGFHFHLSKPIQSNELVTVLASLLEAQREAGPPRAAEQDP